MSKVFISIFIFPYSNEREPGWDNILAWIYYITGLLDFCCTHKNIIADFLTLSIWSSAKINPKKFDLVHAVHVCSLCVSYDLYELSSSGGTIDIKKFTSTRAIVAGTKGRWAWSIDMPTLTANIFAAATSITHIYNKDGGMKH